MWVAVVITYRDCVKTTSGVISLKAFIVHMFTACGGGERVSLEIASVLRDQGFSVVFATNSALGLRRCSELFNIPCDYDVLEVRSFVERLLATTGRFVRYRRLALVLKALEQVLKLKEEGLVVDTWSNGAFSVDVAYIHYPVLLETVRSRALHWRLYNWLVARKVARSVGKPRLVLANSYWTAGLVRELYGLEAEVLHPPVDVEYFAYDGTPKEKVIVTVSRLTQEKNLHLLPRVASKIPSYDWYLIGTTGSTPSEKHASNRVIRMIEGEKKRWSVENFHLITDLPRRDLRKALLKAAFYVHPEFPEHFGIAVVEAMSAGAVPIVYRSGGAWTDVVSGIDPVLGYSGIAEVPSIIRSLEVSQKVEELRRKAVERAQAFSVAVFRERFTKILNDYLEEARG